MNCPHRLVAANGRVHWFVALQGTWWKVFYQVVGDRHWYSQGGQYFTEADAIDAAHRYAQD